MTTKNSGSIAAHMFLSCPEKDEPESMCGKKQPLDYAGVRDVSFRGLVSL